MFMSDILEAIQKRSIWSQLYIRYEHICDSRGTEISLRLGTGSCFLNEDLMEMASCNVKNGILNRVLWCTDNFSGLLIISGFTSNNSSAKSLLPKAVTLQTMYTAGWMNQNLLLRRMCSVKKQVETAETCCLYSFSA